ncbi:hypothetical protein K1719_002393 [Acacia pycnantha]|nr:hypothetical protein K1719_002393 [Acacia pycnantha]
MLLIYFGERFPLGKAVQHVGKSPIQFWTKEKVLKDLYANLMGIINDGHKKLVASVEDELRKAQTHIERQWKQQVGKEDDGEDSQDGHDYEAQEGHRDGHHDDDGHHGSEARYEDDAYQDDASIGTPINIDESDGESASVGGTNEGEQSKSIVLYPVQYPVQQEGGAQQEDAAPRRILIQIDDENITREQLQTLGRRNRLSNRVMSVVCKTLMLDMKRDMKREGQSQVRRHIFSADQMVYLSKNQASNKKKTAGASPQAKAIAKIRERFEDIIQFVNPNHNTKRPRTEDIWPSVPQQPNLQDCGAHVLIWLHNWSLVNLCSMMMMS